MEPEVRNKLDLAIEIRDVYAREILDFAGNPAIEVEVLAGGEIIGKASMAGKNYSKKEQTEKQQVHIEEKIELLNSQIAPEIIGENVFEQRKIDTILKENGNEQTSFAISLAVARAAAAAEKRQRPRRTNLPAVCFRPRKKERRLPPFPLRRQTADKPHGRRRRKAPRRPPGQKPDWFRRPAP